MKYIEELPTADQFMALFETTGWNKKYELSKEELHQCISNSWYTISIIENEELIGFGRVITDGICHALLLDVIIHPDRQGKGFGKNIMERLVSKCKEHKIRDIQLFSAKGKAEFYYKLGFKGRSTEAPGMELEKYW